jgi:hypothetical protein
MLKGALAKRGYDWWWHSFTGQNKSTGQSQTFFIEYFVCNPELGGAKPVLGQLPENQTKQIQPSYALTKVGYWGDNATQIHNFYGIDEFESSDDKLEVSIGTCTLTETFMQGQCSVSKQEAMDHPEWMSGAGEMSWSLAIDKKIAFNVGYGASPFVRKLNAFEMFWHAEGIKTEYSGTVTLNGVDYEVTPEQSFGYADKNWGGDFTSPWLWISSCHLQSLITGKQLNNSALELGGGQPKVYGISLGRKLLGCMYYEGEMFEYNFSKFWTGAQLDFNFTEGASHNHWRVVAKNRHSRMELELTCPKQEMLFVNYESPDGQKRHNRLWNGGTGRGEIKLYRCSGKSEQLLDHIRVESAGCEYGEYDQP